MFKLLIEPNKNFEYSITIMDNAGSIWKSGISATHRCSENELAEQVKEVLRVTDNLRKLPPISIKTP
jgi:hypothetical protein